MTDTNHFERVDEGALARIRLTNPEKHNAFDDRLIAGLTTAFVALGEDDAIRAVVLEAEGKSFSAGADLNWMKRMAGYSDAENRADAMALADLMRTINDLPKPTIAKVQGAAFGGGVGLIACCDIAVASETAKFSLSEVKLGLIPAVISPYVVAAMGARAARRYFQTAEVFSAGEAHRLGLVHEVVAPDALDAKVDNILGAIAKVGPNSAAEAKKLIVAVDRPITEDVLADTAERIARIRASEEGREGVSAFLDKRMPGWAASSLRDNNG